MENIRVQTTNIFILAYAIGWGISIPILLKLLPASLGMIAASSAGISGLIIISLTEGKDGLRKLLSSLVNWRVKPVWYVVVIFLFPIVTLIALGINVILGYNPPVIQDSFAIIFVFIMLIFTLIIVVKLFSPEKLSRA